MRKLKSKSENQGIRKKKPFTRSRTIFFLKFKMITNLMPAEATHTTFDMFEKQPRLITPFDNPFTQKNGPSANGVKISNTHGNYANKAFIETECSSGKTAKNTWLICQGYYYENESAEIDGTNGRANDVAARKSLVANSQENLFIGKPASDILTCDKQLLCE